MNERIKEFAKSAGFNPYNYEGGNAGLFNRFAELIIKECTNLDFSEVDYISIEGEEQIRDLIRKHFGVE